MDSPHVMLRIMCTGAPRTGAVDILRQIDKSDMGWDAELFDKSEGGGAVSDRNVILAEARKSEADFIIYGCDDLFLDDATVLKRLPEHDLPIVDCLIPFTRNGHLYWHFYQLTDGGFWFSDNPYGKTGLHQVYSTSIGFCCIRADVFNNTELWPLWEDDINPDGTRRMFGSADTYMCQKLHRANIPIHVDTDIVFDHKKPIMVKETMDMVRQWAQRIRTDESDLDYALPSRMGAYAQKFGIELPVCDSYREVQKTLIPPPGMPEREA